MLHFRKNPSGLFSSAGNSAGFRNDYSGFEQRIPLEPGDIFYLFTEGFVGADVSGESFENFREILKTYTELPLQKGMLKIQEVIGGSKDQIPNCPDRMLISFSV
jgi:serine phosphatase RsbU (regulator of sigma subunit)